MSWEKTGPFFGLAIFLVWAVGFGMLHSALKEASQTRERADVYYDVERLPRADTRQASAE